METYKLAHTGEELDEALAGRIVTEELDVTENGIYVPGEGVDGFSKVTVETKSEQDFIDSMANGNWPIGEIALSCETVAETAFAYRTGITSVRSESVKQVMFGGFKNCSNLTSLDFRNVESIYGSAFSACGFASLYLPRATTITGDSSFSSCKSLKEVVLPAAKYLGRLTFDYCSALETLDIHVATSISWNVNRGNNKFKALIIRTPTVCSASQADILSNGCFASGQAYVYVPSELVESYKNATNWSAIATQIRSLEDYTVDGTTTGELDWDKINEEASE